MLSIGTGGRNKIVFLLTVVLSLDLVCNKDIFIQDHDDHSSVTCENEIVNLKCPTYHGLRILDAFWGRRSKKKCPFIVRRKTTTNYKRENKTDTVLCIDGIDQEGILWRVQQVCENMGTCSVPAYSAFLGINETCPHVYKYMELNVRCRKYDLETWVGDVYYY